MKKVFAFIAIILLAFSCKKSSPNSNTNTSVSCKPGNGVMDIDGNSYTSIIIGTQEWTVENLTVTRYKNNDAIGNITDNTAWSNATTGGWCYYNNDVTNSPTYGKLYNWFAVSDPRGLAPTGWHIPSEIEWQTLITYLGGDSLAGGKMKEKGLAHWTQTDSTVTNSSCYDGLPGGERNYNINTPFFQLGDYGNWWTSSTAPNNEAWEFNLIMSNSFIDQAQAPKMQGYSVRCIKD